MRESDWIGRIIFLVIISWSMKQYIKSPSKISFYRALIVRLLVLSPSTLFAPMEFVFQTIEPIMIIPLHID